MKVKLMRRFLYFLLILPAFAACSGRDGVLKPLRTVEPGQIMLAAQPQLVTFSDLQNDPEAFQDRLVRVSGTLLKLPPPTCIPNSGPVIEWALIAEELRMDAIGFERAIRLLVDGTPMTVDGIFRLYEGPLGCGKGAPEGSAWFLEVIRIVQPNPLVGAGGSAGVVVPSTTTSGGPLLPPGSSATPTIQSTPPGTGTPGAVPTMTPVGGLPPTATMTPAGGTPSTTSIPTATATSLSTPQLTSTSTLLTPTSTPTPTSTRGPGPTPTPTATLGGYPNPATPTPTGTVDGYPPSPPRTVTPTSYP